MVSRKGTKRGSISYDKVINTYFLQDERLSFKARGILGYWLSKKKTWKGQVFDLCNNSENDRKTAIQSGIEELVELGYAKLKCFPRKENGTFQGKYYEFNGKPIFKTKPSSTPVIEKEQEKCIYSNYLSEPCLDMVNSHAFSKPKQS